MRRHELDVFSLVAGLVLLIIATGHLLIETTSVHIDGRWLVPLVLVALGGAGLAGSLRRRQTDTVDTLDTVGALDTLDTVETVETVETVDTES